MIARRTLLTASLLVAPAMLTLPALADERNAGLQRLGTGLEQKYGGRLGIAILDTARNHPLAYRGDERFPLCSTFKLLAASFVLARVDRKQENLSRRIVYTNDIVVPYSPITGNHVGGTGLSVSQICDAAVTLSDNTAGNLMLGSFGGPVALTAYLRSLGDPVTRLDRTEPTLNEAKLGDPRDTTTPIAMLQTIRKLVLDTALSPASRAQLIAWIVACKTGGKRLRADVPKDWRAGDKTGSGENNATNDVAVIWPPQRAPIIITAYYTESHAPDEQRQAVLAQVGKHAIADN